MIFFFWMNYLPALVKKGNKCYFYREKLTSYEEVSVSDTFNVSDFYFNS